MISASAARQDEEVWQSFALGTCQKRVRRRFSVTGNETRHQHTLASYSAYETHKQSNNAPCLTLDFFNTATPSQILQYFRGLRNADIVRPIAIEFSKFPREARPMTAALTNHRSVYYIIWTANRPPRKIVRGLGPRFGRLQFLSRFSDRFQVKFWVLEPIDGGAALCAGNCAHWAPAEGFLFDSTPRGNYCVALWKCFSRNCAELVTSRSGLEYLKLYNGKNNHPFSHQFFSNTRVILLSYSVYSFDFLIF